VDAARADLLLAAAARRTIRYSQNGFTRQTVGGCGDWNADADWANDTVVAKLNGTVRNAASHRDVEHRVFGAERARRPPPVRAPTACSRAGARELALAGAADRSEWVSQIRTTTTLFGPYQLRRTHTRPTGTSAAQLRAPGLTTPAPARGTCSRTATGLNAQGEPDMSFG
jgi:hypothetical protein